MTGRGLAAVALPLVPPLTLLAALAAHAVNVPRWDDWSLVPFVAALRDGTVGLSEFWAQHNEHRLASVKLILVPLVLATDFDVRAMMYAGVVLHLIALGFLWSLIRSTLPPGDQPLAVVVAVSLSCLMFSPAQDENWLWGITAIQWHLCNLTAAAAVWLLARRPRTRLVFAACFVLTFAGMQAVASGMVLWAVVLVAVVTENIAFRRRVPARWLILWAAAAAALAGGYFAGFRPNPGPSYVFYGFAHPVEFATFVAVYLGNPFVHAADLRWAAAIGAAGVIAYCAAFHAVVVRRYRRERILPWLWLGSYPLMVAVVTAIGRTRFGIFVATTNRYTTGALFFWVALLAIGAIVVSDLAPRSRPAAARTLRAAAALTLIAGAVNYARLYRDGYLRFVQIRHDRTIALAEVSRLDAVPDEVVAHLYGVAAGPLRDYARTLRARRLGPFAPHMGRERGRAAAATATARDAKGGEGAMDPPQCAFISGWAWDPRQPDVPVEVELYAGSERVATVPAYWYRRDLAAAGLGGGRHAYVFPPPPRLKDGRAHEIRARVAGAERDLTGSPSPLLCPAG